MSESESEWELILEIPRFSITRSPFWTYRTAPAESDFKKIFGVNSGIDLQFNDQVSAKIIPLDLLIYNVHVSVQSCVYFIVKLFLCKHETMTLFSRTFWISITQTSRLSMCYGCLQKSLCFSLTITEYFITQFNICIEP